MGGRGGSSTSFAVEWKNSRKNPVTIFDGNPIGASNEKMFKDTLKNVTSIYPIEQINNSEIKTVKGALGVARIGVDYIDLGNGEVEIKGYVSLAFDDAAFVSEMALLETMANNYDVGDKIPFLATGQINHIPVHELGHVLDYQLSLKKNGNMSLSEFTTPRIIKASELFTEMERLSNLYQVNFSDGIAEAVAKEMKINNFNELIGMVSEYASDSESEFFAEAFAKSYLAKNKDDPFVKAFNKVLKERIEKL